MLDINHRIRIPVSELDFSFSRSSGPGGQNVNKVNTKVTLRWNVAASRHLPEAVRKRFQQRFRRRINQQGHLLLHSQRYRDQGRNVADCLDKLRQMLLGVAHPPPPRKPTRPTRGSKERRLRQKKEHSEKKRRRREID